MMFFRALLAVTLVHCSAGQRWVKLCDMISSTEWEQTNTVGEKRREGKKRLEACWTSCAVSKNICDCDCDCATCASKMANRSVNEY